MHPFVHSLILIKDILIHATFSLYHYPSNTWDGVAGCEMNSAKESTIYYMTLDVNIANVANYYKTKCLIGTW